MAPSRSQTQTPTGSTSSSPFWNSSAKNRFGPDAPRAPEATVSCKIEALPIQNCSSTGETLSLPPSSLRITLPHKNHGPGESFRELQGSARLDAELPVADRLDRPEQHEDVEAEVVADHPPRE